MELQRAQRLQFALLEVAGHLGVGLEHLEEIGVVAPGVLHLPGLHGVALDQRVGVFSGQAFADQGQQHGLAVPHTQAETQVLAHVLRVDQQAVHQPGEQAEHVVEQRARVGEDDPFHRAVADVALMPQGHVLEGGHGVAADHAGQAGEALPGDGVALVRHGAAALLAPGEGFFGLQDFGALEVAELDGPVLEARGHQGQAVHEFGMDVALDDLGGDGSGLESKALADMGLDRGRQVGVGADRAAELAQGDDRTQVLVPGQGPRELLVHQGQLQPEGGGLAMDAVAAADAGSQPVFAGPPGDDGQQGLHVPDEQIEALHHLDGEGRVHDVGAGEAEVQPAAGRIVDAFGHRRGEGDDVVIEHLLQLALAGEQSGRVALPGRAALLDLEKILLRHHALAHQRLAGEFLDVEPQAQLVLLGPDRPHFGP